ncbi:unnamed protein product, partial [marine sediment metagenome]
RSGVTDLIVQAFRFAGTLTPHQASGGVISSWTAGSEPTLVVRRGELVAGPANTDGIVLAAAASDFQELPDIGPGTMVRLLGFTAGANLQLCLMWSEQRLSS